MTRDNRIPALIACVAAVGFLGLACREEPDTAGVANDPPSRAAASAPANSTATNDPGGRRDDLARERNSEAMGALIRIVRHLDYWHRGKTEQLTLTCSPTGDVSDGRGHSLKVTPQEWAGLLDYIARLSARQRGPHMVFRSAASGLFSDGKPDPPDDAFGELPIFVYEIKPTSGGRLQFRCAGLRSEYKPDRPGG